MQVRIQTTFIIIYVFSSCVISFGQTVKKNAITLQKQYLSGLATADADSFKANFELPFHLLLNDTGKKLYRSYLTRRAQKHQLFLRNHL